LVEEVIYECKNLYDKLLYAGVAPEQARMVLPQNMMTSWWWSGSLDAFANMCTLRCKPDAQYETRLVADLISEKMGELFPVSWRALVQ
jgi:thymidylate synthase (FAD)